MCIGFLFGWVFGFGYFFVGFWWIGVVFFVEVDWFVWFMFFVVFVMLVGLVIFIGFGVGLVGFLWSD